jgi:two-component system alkaline phosphatase synthesis response regulator PhoP
MTQAHRILIADDDRDLTRSIALFLGKRGYEVTTAANGREALAEIERERPDLCVLDVMMDSDTEGLNLAYRLNEDERTRDMPVVILSGFTRKLRQKHDTFAFLPDRGWPAAKLLEKPVELSQLAESIANLLREAEALRAVLGAAARR